MPCCTGMPIASLLGIEARALALPVGAPMGFQSCSSRARRAVPLRAAVRDRLLSSNVLLSLVKSCHMCRGAFAFLRRGVHGYTSSLRLILNLSNSVMWAEFTSVMYCCIDPTSWDTKIMALEDILACWVHNVSHISIVIFLLCYTEPLKMRK